MKFLIYHFLGFAVTAVMYLFNIAAVAGVLTGVVSFTGLPYGAAYPGFAPIFGGLTCLTGLLWTARLVWKLPRIVFVKQGYDGQYVGVNVVPETRKEVP